MNWKIIADLGFISLSIFMLVPAGLAFRWVVVKLYQAYLTWKRDQIELEALREIALARARTEQLVHLKPDTHGFGGVVYDQAQNVYTDLDTGAIFKAGKETVPDVERTRGNIKQRMLAALAGSRFYQRVVNGIIEEESKPQIQIEEGGEWLQLEPTQVGGEVEV